MEKKDLSISYEDFIKIWQDAKDIEEVKKKTKLTSNQLYGRYNRLKKRGVPLKKMRIFPTTKQDWNKLKALAQELGDKYD